MDQCRHLVGLRGVPTRPHVVVNGETGVILGLVMTARDRGDLVDIAVALGHGPQFERCSIKYKSPCPSEWWSGAFMGWLPMAFWARPTRMSLLVSLSAMALLALLAASAHAGDRDIHGDWVITGGVTHVSNETIDVRGNVTIDDGGVLRLEDCTLIINGTQDGRFRLLVNSTGRLEALRSTIEGAPARFRFHVLNDTLLDRCNVSHLHGETYSSGLVLWDGDTTIRDTLMSDSLHYTVTAYADVVIEGSTFGACDRGHLFSTNSGVREPITISVRCSWFDGSTSSSTYTTGVVVASYQNRDSIDLRVTDTRFDSFNIGVSLHSDAWSTYEVEDCDLFDCASGFRIRQTAGTISVRNSTIDGDGGSTTCGIYARTSQNAGLVVDGVAIRETGTAVSLYSAPTVTLGNLTVRDCGTGVSTSTQGTLAVGVWDSTFSSVTNCFQAGYETQVSVHRTVHEPGSATVVGTRSWVRGYALLDVSQVRWWAGPSITHGEVHLLDDGGSSVTLLDAAALAPREILGWEMTEGSSFTHRLLHPAIKRADRWFHGVEFNIWDPSSNVIVIVDDELPAVSITQPENGTAVNASRPLVTGSYLELGSGLAFLECSVDESPFVLFTSFENGRWGLVIPALVDGDHVLSVRPTDASGNMGNTSRVEFLVDTVVPFLDLLAPDAWTNRTELLLEGRTEPGSVLTMNGEDVPLSRDGAFGVTLQLVEGANAIDVLVRDRAGNVNAAAFVVECDLVPPFLEVSAPTDGSWTNATRVKVVGTVEVGSFLTVNDVTVVEGRDGIFTTTLALTETDFPILVIARDLAGNAASVRIVLHVDWTPPRLTMSQPGEDVVCTRDPAIWIYGEVDDPTIEHVQINNRSVKVFGEGFSKHCTLLEGRNGFEVTAVDAAGNGDAVTFLVVRDLTPPSYEVDLTAVSGEVVGVGGRLYSTSASLEVVVTIDEPAVLLFRNGTTAPAAEEHRWRLGLEEGRNLLWFDVEDRAGNRGQSFSGDVYLDTTAPPLSILEPLPGYSTEEDRVVVHGRTEPGSTVRVEGLVVEVDTEGDFRAVLDLLPGTNRFSIVVSDGMGNSNDTDLSIVRVGPTGGGGGDLSMWLTLAVLTFLVLGLGTALLLKQRAQPPVEGAVDERREAPSPGTADVDEGPEDGSVPASEWEEY